MGSNITDDEWNNYRKDQQDPDNTGTGIESPASGADRQKEPVYIKCQYCGAENPKGSRFCNACGKPFLDKELSAEKQKNNKNSSARRTIIAASAIVGVLLIGGVIWAIMSNRTSQAADTGAGQGIVTAEAVSETEEEAAEPAEEAQEEAQKEEPEGSKEAPDETPDEICDEDGNLRIQLFKNESGIVTDEYHYDSEGNTTLSIRYEVTDNGQLLRETVFDKDSNVSYRAEFYENWNRSSSVLYRDGKKSDESSYFKDGTIKTGKYYDEDGNLSYEFYNDEKGNLIRSTTYFEDSESISFSYELTYNSSGQLVREITIDEDENVRGEKEFFYDHSGNRTEELSYDKNGSLVSTTKSTYNNAGQLVERYTRSAQSGEITDKSSFEYDSDGREIHCEHLAPFNNYASTDYSYDVNGRLVGRRDVSYNGTGDHIITFDYDYMDYLVLQSTENS